MAFTLDSDPTSATFNCYVSVSYADDYFSVRFGAENWADEELFPDEKKQALLVTATRLLDSLKYGGMKASPSQPMQWPRQLLTDFDAVTIPSDEMPDKMLQATCEMAYWKWTEEDRWFSDTDLQQIKQYKAGPVDAIARGNPATFPREVTSLIESIGPGVLLTNTSNKATGGRLVL